MPKDAGKSRPEAPATEQRNPATNAIDRMNPLEIAQAMNAEDARVAEAVRHELPQIAAAMQVIAERLRAGARLIYLGAGTSGRLGALDAVECPPTFNIPADRVIACVAGGADALAGATEFAEDDAELGRADIERLAAGPLDVVVGISASGSTPYTLGGLAAARERGAYTIGLACNAGSPLERLVNIMIAPRVGPEVIAGSTRLKAGAAQKMVLNTLSTGAMILLGKTYGNQMVDVQATNDKLRARARAIVETATGLEAAEAAALLRQADGDTKVAILIGRAGLTPVAARAQLAAHDGNLRRALEAE